MIEDILSEHLIPGTAVHPNLSTADCVCCCYCTAKDPDSDDTSDDEDDEE